MVRVLCGTEVELVGRIRDIIIVVDDENKKLKRT